MGLNNKFVLLDNSALNEHKLLRIIIEKYLKGNQFNGSLLTSFFANPSDTNTLPFQYIVQGQNNDQYINSEDFQNLKEVIKKMIKDNKLQLLPANLYGFINRQGFPSIEDQISYINSEDAPDSYLYPSYEVLENNVDKSLYQSCPYVLKLALGMPQLDFEYFELNILEYYRNDPRYIYEDSGIEGSITVKNEYANDLGNFYLKMFSYAVNKDSTRYVAVFLKHMSILPEKDQVRWSLSEINGVDFHVHPDFLQRNLFGHWGSGLSIITAILMRISIANQYCSQVGISNIFCIEEDILKIPPKEFMFLIRPTQRAYHEFIQTLEKLVCNMSYDFFKDCDIQTHKQRYNECGNLDKKPIGTIALLDCFAKKHFKNLDNDAWTNDVIKVFRDIRKERQKPAHKLLEDDYDKEYIKKQTQLLEKTYIAVQIISVALGSMDGTDDSKIEYLESLQKSTIYSI